VQLGETQPREVIQPNVATLNFVLEKVKLLDQFVDQLGDQFLSPMKT
jgi:hypothetical protein